MKHFLLLTLAVFFANLIYAQTATEVLYPQDTLLAKNYPDRAYNFISYPEVWPLGDVNGDGKDDYYSYYATNNPETDYFGDTKMVTGVIFGGETDKKEYDLLIESRIYPAGDLNNDGYADFVTEEYVADQRSPVRKVKFNNETSSLVDDDGVEISWTPNAEFLNFDLDGDGYNDIIQNTEDGYNTKVMFGGDALNALETKTYDFHINQDELNDTASVSQANALNVVIGDVNQDGRTEITTVILYTLDEYYENRNANRSFYVATYSMNEDRELVKLSSSNPPLEKYYISPGIDTYSFSGERIRSYLADTNLDGDKELVVSGQFYTNNMAVLTVYFDNSDPDSVFDTLHWLILDEELEDPRVRRSELQSFGDFNGDGVTNFLYQIFDQDGEASIGTDKEEGLYLARANIEGKIVLEQRLEDVNVYQKRSFFGADVNGDGFEDLITYSGANAGGARIIYYGNENSNLSDYSETPYTEFIDYASYDTRYILNLSDMDNDGIDDVGVVKDGLYQTSYCCFDTPLKKNDWLEIYLSGTNDLDSGIPTLVIEDTSLIEMHYPAVGDFNGDGTPDIAINYASDSQHVGGGIHIYFGGSALDNTPDHILDYNSLMEQEDYMGFPYLNNIGDINKDGIEDLIFASQNTQSEKSYVLYGGIELSDSWDLEIPFRGVQFENVGDMNGDDLNEIAITNPDYGNYPYDPNFIEKYAMGKINVYSAFDEAAGEEFNTVPLLEIVHEENYSETNLYQFGSNITTGDFDGDGFSDLATLVGNHYDLSTHAGLELMYIYSGGIETDSLPEVGVKIPSKYFLNEHTEQYPNTPDFFNQKFGYISGISDLNDDGKDELILQATPYYTNAIMYNGDDLSVMFENDPVKFYAPNQFLSLRRGGPYSSNVFTLNYGATVGDFTGNGQKEILFKQQGRHEFLSDPVYMYFGEVPTSHETEIQLPGSFELHQNYPNPFNPVTNITYSVSTNSEVRIEIFNVLGQKVQTLVNEKMQAGKYTIAFDAKNLASGMYLYRMSTSAGYVQTHKMLLVK